MLFAVSEADRVPTQETEQIQCKQIQFSITASCEYTTIPSIHGLRAEMACLRFPSHPGPILTPRHISGVLNKEDPSFLHLSIPGGTVVPLPQ